MKLYILSSGRIYLEKAFLWHFGPKEDSGKEYVPKVFTSECQQYFLDHPKAKILFDTGWKLEELAKVQRSDDVSKTWGFPMREGPGGLHVQQKPHENLVAQLDTIGIKVDEIDYVVMSHLMTDHAGWLPVFAGKKAKIIIQKKEYKYARRIALPNISGEPPPVEQFHSWMYRRHHFDIPGLKFKFVEGNYKLVKDVMLLSAPGHTPGYQVMMVRLPKTGAVILSPCEHLGMYYSIPINCTGERAPGIPHTFTWFAAEELRSFRTIREIVSREKGQIFCGHDSDQFSNLKHAPEHYE